MRFQQSVAWLTRLSSLTSRKKSQWKDPVQYSHVVKVILK